MAIITFSNLRGGTAGWPDIKIPGGASATVTNATLTTAIASAELLLNSICDAQFVGDTQDVALIMDGPEADRLGHGRSTLLLPKMVQFDTTNKDGVITSVEERDDSGNWTTVDSTTYRSTSSEPNALNVMDTDAIIRLSGTWTTRPQAIKVTGKFGFATTPEWAKRCVALIVFDWYGNQNIGLHRAEQWQTDSAIYRRGQEIAFGMPEMEEFIRRYKLQRDLMAAS